MPGAGHYLMFSSNDFFSKMNSRISQTIQIKSLDSNRWKSQTSSLAKKKLARTHTQVEWFSQDMAFVCGFFLSLSDLLMLCRTKQNTKTKKNICKKDIYLKPCTKYWFSIRRTLLWKVTLILAKLQSCYSHWFSWLISAGLG